MLLKKSLEMFNLSKSELNSPTDLRDSKTVQHKVLCDWLRQIHNQNIQLARKVTILQQSIAAILENESSAEDMAITNGDITDTESVR